MTSNQEDKIISEFLESIGPSASLECHSLMPLPK